MIRKLIAVALVTALALPASAAAQGTLPPDDSGVDEYVEGIPGPKGSVPSGKVGKGKDREDEALPPTVVRELEALGADGRATAELAEATAPSRSDSARRARDGEDDGSYGSAGGESNSGSSAISAVVGKLVGRGEGGMGFVLPLILLVTALSAVAVVVARRLRAGER